MTRHYFGRAIATYYIADCIGDIPHGPHIYINPVRDHEPSTSPHYRDIGQGRAHLIIRPDRAEWEYADIDVIPDWVCDKQNIEIFWETE